MPHRVENVETRVWHRIIEDLAASGFVKVYEYGGADAGIDYSRYDLMDGGETLVFEWDNWSEGSVEGTPSRLEAIREKYRLSEVVEE